MGKGRGALTGLRRGNGLLRTPTCVVGIMLFTLKSCMGALPGRAHEAELQP